MQPPVKGFVTMGLDPGYAHGCKVAVIDLSLIHIFSEALKQEKVAKFTEGKQIVKVILVKNKLVNLIVKKEKPVCCFFCNSGCGKNQIPGKNS